jgi:hypothetical protein
MRLALPTLLLALAAPASAQIAGNPDPIPTPRRTLFFDDGRLPGPGTSNEMRQVRRTIERARERGLITHREARELRRESRRIEASSYRYGRDGLSRSEHDELAARTQALRSQVTRPRRGG